MKSGQKTDRDFYNKTTTTVTAEMVSFQTKQHKSRTQVSKYVH